MKHFTSRPRIQTHFQESPPEAIWTPGKPSIERSDGALEASTPRHRSPSGHTAQSADQLYARSWSLPKPHTLDGWKHRRDPQELKSKLKLQHRPLAGIVHAAGEE